MPNPTISATDYAELAGPEARLRLYRDGEAILARVLGVRPALIYIVVSLGIVGTAVTFTATENETIATVVASVAGLAYVGFRLPRSLQLLRSNAALQAIPAPPITPDEAESLPPRILIPADATTASRLDRILAYSPSDRLAPTSATRTTTLGVLIIMLGTFATVVFALGAALLAAIQLAGSGTQLVLSLAALAAVSLTTGAVEWVIVAQVQAMTRRDRAIALEQARARLAANAIVDDGQTLTVVRRTEHGLEVDPQGLRRAIRPAPTDFGVPLGALSRRIRFHIGLAFAAPIIAVLAVLLP